MDEQSRNQTSTDPGTVSIPPAEGRTDSGEEQGKAHHLPPAQAANATTSETDQLLSKEPAEGRTDVAQDLAQEQKQSANASTGRVSHRPSKKGRGEVAEDQRPPATRPED
jgi:hypothetical protein